MLATLFCFFVLHAISGLSTDPYRVDKPTGSHTVTIPVPKEYTILKINNAEYSRVAKKCELVTATTTTATEATTTPTTATEATTTPTTATEATTTPTTATEATTTPTTATEATTTPTTATEATTTPSTATEATTTPTTATEATTTPTTATEDTNPGEDGSARRTAATSIDCDYAEGQATALIPDVTAIAWIGFKMPYETEAGYQTVYFSQNQTWSAVNADGCIMPQNSSAGLIAAHDVSSVIIKCARKKTCPVKDYTLMMSVEGTKKCEVPAPGRTATTPTCKKETAPATAAASSLEVEVYELSVRQEGAADKTYVYCGTETSQISFVIDWTSGVRRVAYTLATLSALPALVWL